MTYASQIRELTIDLSLLTGDKAYRITKQAQHGTHADLPVVIAVPAVLKGSTTDNPMTTGVPDYKFTMLSDLRMALLTAVKPTLHKMDKTDESAGSYYIETQRPSGPNRFEAPCTLADVTDQTRLLDEYNDTTGVIEGYRMVQSAMGAKVYTWSYRRLKATSPLVSTHSGVTGRPPAGRKPWFDELWNSSLSNKSNHIVWICKYTGEECLICLPSICFMLGAEPKAYPQGHP
ncbi:uncharacterized protein BCR38DRAFT_470873 [Pseudomassariella vexata]|uniref:Uncharacterized protein n=1 Tax=Pseudomassariella vexata TaxID=1141098 RepID=A0A1Y2EL95_9PEZI|nr:uncharacterized protein BCR38DRAFT_470873 [Pseudomassariella vexata]ORY72064.1 hypothetical protein BCR38DRAFT_470873 [Pseudomassariella vexata]